MRLLVCGSRAWTDRQAVFDALDAIHALHHVTQVIEGTCRGPDQYGGEWAKAQGIRLTEMPADWDRHGTRAGFIRNSKMADLGPDMVVGFIVAGSRGTKMMLEISLARGFDTRLVRPGQRMIWKLEKGEHGW